MDLSHNSNNSLYITNDSTIKFVSPLIMVWKPKEDITTYELALCLPYLIRQHSIMPGEIDITLSYFRHFEITDPNE